MAANDATTAVTPASPPPTAVRPSDLSPETAAILAEVWACSKPFLTPARVGSLLGVTGATVIAMAGRGDLDYVRFGAGGRIRIPKSAVVRLLTPPDSATA